MKRSILIALGTLLISLLVLVACVRSEKTTSVTEPSPSSYSSESREVISKFSLPLDESLYNEGIVNVGFASREDLERFAKEVDANITFVDEKLKLASLKLNGKTVREVMMSLKDYDLKGIDFVEPDYKIEIPVIREEELMTKFEPRLTNTPGPTAEDEWRIYQYALDLFDAESIWREGFTGKDVIVAIVDTGVNGLHPDLAGRMVNGLNARTGGTLVGAAQTDTNGHGSHCAGIVAAGFGGGKVVGLAPEAKIMPIGILGGYSTTRTNIASAIRWAVDNGARVLSNSWGGPGYTLALKRGIDYALERGAIFVASAGNDHSYQHWHYPTGYTGVIGVAATTANDRVVGFSSRGDYVSVGAPGTNILSIFHINSLLSLPYTYMSGTSMACPYVSAAAALLKQKYPNANAYQIRKILELTAVDIEEPGYDPASGYGRINPKAALGLDPNVRAPNIEDLKPAELEVVITDRNNAPVEHVFVTIKERNTGRMYFEKAYADSLMGNPTRSVARFKFIEPGTYDVYIGGPDIFYGLVFHPEDQVYYARTVTLQAGRKTELVQPLYTFFKVEFDKTTEGEFDYEIRRVSGTTSILVASGKVTSSAGATYILPATASPGQYFVTHNGGANVKARITLNNNTFEVTSVADTARPGWFNLGKFSSVYNRFEHRFRVF